MGEGPPLMSCHFARSSRNAAAVFRMRHLSYEAFLFTSELTSGPEKDTE